MSDGEVKSVHDSSEKDHEGLEAGYADEHVIADPRYGYYLPQLSLH